MTETPEIYHSGYPGEEKGVYANTEFTFLQNIYLSNMHITESLFKISEGIREIKTKLDSLTTGDMKSK